MAVWNHFWTPKFGKDCSIFDSSEYNILQIGDVTPARRMFAKAKPGHYQRWRTTRPFNGEKIDISVHFFLFFLALPSKKKEPIPPESEPPLDRTPSTLAAAEVRGDRR